MSFNDNLPQHFKELRDKYTKLRWQKADMYHSCDCPYCEHEEMLLEDYTEEDVEKIEAEMEEIGKTAGSLREYAKLHNIDLSEEALKGVKS